MWVIIIIFCFVSNNSMSSEEEAKRQEEIRKHHEKWKKWKLQLKMKDYDKKSKNGSQKQIMIGKPQDNARQYARKLIQKLQQPQQKQCPISKNVAEQLQTNTCTICFQLMAPPNNPYILFPCGHNICKICLFVNGDQKKQKYTLKLNKCPLCRITISNHAQNRNLMKLIISYMNNKDLLQKQQQNDAKKKQQTDTITKLTQHCTLLQNEKKNLYQNLLELKKNKKVLEEVIDRLLDQRRRCRREIDALEDQARLVNKHVNQKEEELDKVQNKITGLEERQYSIQATLAPLKAHKEKLQIEEAEKLIKKK